jgi:hypothetical protein
MPKRPRSNNQTHDSVRWPSLFADQEAAQSLVHQAGFLKMLEDLEALRQALEYDVIHNTPTMEFTNFCRGQIAVLERMRDLPQELQEWKASHR